MRPWNSSAQSQNQTKATHQNKQHVYPRHGGFKRLDKDIQVINIRSLLTVLNPPKTIKIQSGPGAASDHPGDAPDGPGQLLKLLDLS